MSIAFGRLLESLPVHVEAKILSPENPPAALSLSKGVESGKAQHGWWPPIAISARVWRLRWPGKRDNGAFVRPARNAYIEVETVPKGQSCHEI
jgi:hypothetical protein